MVPGVSGEVGEWGEPWLLGKLEGREDKSVVGEVFDDAVVGGDLERGGRSSGNEVVEDGSEDKVLDNADSSGMMVD